MSEPKAMFTDQEKDFIWRTKANQANADEFAQFMHMAERCNLDPIANQIYFVKRGGKGTIQVGIDGLRLIADRTGAYAGSDDAEFPPSEGTYPPSARVVVYKMVQGQRCPFSATARWSEYFPGDGAGGQWKKMPHVMLGKVAEALALRKAFPADMSGLYTSEEMEQAGTSEAAPQEPQRPKEPTTPIAPSSEASVNAQPGTTAAPSGTPPLDAQAYGYVPMRWPVPKMFGEPKTDSQSKMARVKAKERMLEADDYELHRKLVLSQYGFEYDGSKAHQSLWIDFLMSADDDSLDLLSSAVDEFVGQTKMELS